MKIIVIVLGILSVVLLATLRIYVIWWKKQPFKYETVLSMIEYLQNMMISEGKRHEIAYKKKKIGLQ